MNKNTENGKMSDIRVFYIRKTTDVHQYNIA